MDSEVLHTSQSPAWFGILCLSACNDEVIGITCLSEAQLSTIQVNDETYSDNPLHLCK